MVLLMTIETDPIYMRLKEEIHNQREIYLMESLRTEMYKERTFGSIIFPATDGLFLTIDKDDRYNFPLPDWAIDDWGT